MKVGIVTFYNAHNYGAVWQAFALKRYLEKTGNQVEIIQYHNPNIAAAYPKHLHLRLGKKDFIIPSRWGRSLEEYKRIKYSKEEWNVQYQKFEEFIKVYLCNNSEKQWELQVYEKDLIFFGSDQIWEEKITGKDKKIYFGDFDTKARKVSYAASCFSETSVLSDYMISNLRRFDKISVREQAYADKLKKILSKEVIVVSDPVFLLDSKSYESLICKSNNKEPYVLFYFVNEDPELQKISTHIKNKFNKRIIEIHYYKLNNYPEEDKIYSAGPLEFLRLFYCASEIYTNSFHGTAFSMIFHKCFYSLSNNMRINNILHIMNLESRKITSYEDWIDVIKNQSVIDYRKVDILKDQYIQVSVDFINSILIR